MPHAHGSMMVNDSGRSVAGPSRTTPTASSSFCSGSRSTIQKSNSTHTYISLPAVSSSSQASFLQSSVVQWDLDPPSDSYEGISFTSSNSTARLPFTSKRLARSPSSVQRAIFATSSTQHGKKNEQRAAYSLVPVHLLENTLKLDSLGVSAQRPDPSIAPKVTLSSRCRPDNKVVFDQIYFARTKGHRSSTRQSNRLTNIGSLTGIGEDEKESLHSSMSYPTSAESSNPLTSPSSISSQLLASYTATTSFTPDIDTQSVTSATSSIPPAATRKPAWSTPRSWADLAAVRSNGVASFAAPFSEHLNGHDTLERRSSQGSELNFNQRSADLTGGKTRTKPSQGPLKLGDVMRDAETRFSAALTYPRGMVNKGNMCFANAILQVLVYCAPFYNLFRSIGEYVAHDFHNRTPLMEAVISFLSEFQRVPKAVQKQLQDTPSLGIDLLRDIQASSEPFVPEYLYDAMKLNKRFDAMRRGHQEDAEEFLGFFLDTLHEELLTVMRKAKESESKDRRGKSSDNASDEKGEETDGDTTEREVKRPMSPTEGDGWLEVGQKGKTSFTRTTSTAHSSITRIFGGKLRSLLRMPGSKDSVTLEPYQPLQLDIQPSHVTTVEDALNNLTVPETIAGVHSASSKGPVDATKQVFIETLPPILILHMKRFVYDDIGGVQKSSKVLGYGPTLEISDSVISPARRAEVKRRYRLFGVVYHHGRFASGGHYTVDVLKQDQTEWLHIDDTTWSTVTAPSVRASGNTGEMSGIKQHHDGVAYLLFYVREDAVLANG